MKHTSGKWYAEKVEAYDNTLVYMRIKSGEKSIAFAGVYKGHNAEANAHLMAAAPELLARIKMILKSRRNNKGEAMNEVSSYVLNKAQQTIDKLGSSINRAERKLCQKL